MSDKDRGRVSDISQAGKEECEDEWCEEDGPVGEGGGGGWREGGVTWERKGEWDRELVVWEFRRAFFNTGSTVYRFGVNLNLCRILFKLVMLN